MHVTTKDSSRDGRSHVLTSVIEADGAAELVREKEKLSAEILSVARTASGGIELKVAVFVGESNHVPVEAEQTAS